MIKEIEITNFKAIGNTVTIPIRPITLLFGANSSGKSSILQCLMLINQIQNGDKNFDIGNFQDFIHQHDINKEFCIKFTCELHKDTVIDSLADYDYFDELIYKDDPLGDIGNAFQQSLEGYDSYSLAYYYSTYNPPSWWDRIELFLGTEKEPVISYFTSNDCYSEYHHDHSYWIKYSDIFTEHIINVCLEYPKSWLRTVGPKPSEETKSQIISLLDIFSNDQNPDLLVQATLLRKIDYIRATKDYPKDIVREYKQELESFNRIFKHEKNPNKLFLKLYQYNQAGNDAWLNGKTFSPNKIANHDFGDLLRTNYEDFTDDFGFDLSNPLLLIPVLSKNIKWFLSRLDYIGPLRETPERYYLPGHKGNNGARALCDAPDLLRRVNNEFLNLQTGFQLEIVKLSNPHVEVDDVFLLQFIDQRNNTKATIKDVGFGFSQILPVVVKSTAEFYKQILIEQPELHLHPAIQAELGDLFIRGAKGIEEVDGPGTVKDHLYKKEKHNQFLLETHSEHLILRLLRRVRETTKNELPNNVPPIKPDDIAVLYMQLGEKGAEVKLIPITEDGEFAKSWPQGFFAERTKEIF